MTALATFTVKTFGCKVNQYDSQLLADGLSALGLLPVAAQERPAGQPVLTHAPGLRKRVRRESLAAQSKEAEPPDLVVVNTCAVTNRSEAKARQFIRRCLRQHPGATVLVTGCAVRRAPEQWRQVGSVESSRLLTVPHPTQAAQALARAGLLPGGAAGPAFLPLRISGFADHDRAFVKVQDGCQSFCSYCIVPFVRPRLWSKPADVVAEEVAHLSRAGYGEIVLVGVHLGLYGCESEGESGLVALVCRLLEETDVGRLRLSSIEPQEVSDELIDLAAGEPRLCPHFHLPLQSGDDRILESMNRRYTVRQYLATLERIARRVPRPALTTDLLVGFPGEGEPEFNRTLAACRRAGFSRIHVFRFGPRPGTRGAALPGRPPEHLVARREGELLALAAELARSYRKQFVGEEAEVLVESRQTPAEPETRPGPTVLTGLTERYLRIRFPGGARATRRSRAESRGPRPGSLARVVVESEDEWGLLGRLSKAPGRGEPALRRCSGP